MRHDLVTILIICLGLSTSSVRADWLITEDRTEWENAVGAYTTIGFTEYPDGTWIFEQYADLGVHFIDGADIIMCCSFATFPIDGAGLDGNDEIHLVFDAPLSYIAVDFPGHVQFDFYSNGQLIYESAYLGHSGIGNFVGLVCPDVFDEVVIYDPPVGDQVFLDDLHFGPPIPAPPAIALLALAACRPGRRRRA